MLTLRTSWIFWNIKLKEIIAFSGTFFLILNQQDRIRIVSLRTLKVKTPLKLLTSKLRGSFNVDLIILYIITPVKRSKM